MKNPTRIKAEKGKQDAFVEREFDAPREMVFTAFSEPEWLVQWLGPSNMTMEIEKLHNVTHGSYRFVHKDNMGNQFAFNGVIHEVDEPARMIRTFEFEGLPERGHVALEFLTLEAIPGDRTRLVIQSVFKSVEDRDGMLNAGMEEGLNEGFEKLDRLFENRVKDI